MEVENLIHIWDICTRARKTLNIRHFKKKDGVCADRFLQSLSLSSGQFCQMIIFYITRQPYKSLKCPQKCDYLFNWFTIIINDSKYTLISNNLCVGGILTFLLSSGGFRKIVLSFYNINLARWTRRLVIWR